jgi:hypothetical protein
MMSPESPGAGTALAATSGTLLLQSILTTDGSTALAMDANDDESLSGAETADVLICAIEDPAARDPTVNASNRIRPKDDIEYEFPRLLNIADTPKLQDPCNIFDVKLYQNDAIFSFLVSVQVQAVS